jgi:hypothetical protein
MILSSRGIIFFSALPICGFAFLNSFQIISTSRHHTNSGRPKTDVVGVVDDDDLILFQSWPSSSEAPLRDFANSHFSSLVNGKSKNTKQSKVQSDTSNNKTFVNTDNENRTLPEEFGDNTTKTLIESNATNITTSHHKHASSSTSNLFGRPTKKNETKIVVQQQQTSGQNPSNKSYYSSLWNNFPFLSNSALLYDVNGNNKSNKSVDIKSNNNLTQVLAGKNQNDTITVADLQLILDQMKMTYQTTEKRVRREIEYDEYMDNDPVLKQISTTTITSANPTTKRSSKQVAFPQPSILSYKDLRRGTSVAGGFIGMIIGFTVLPNLWLVGMIVGSIYGSDITKEPIPGEEPRQHHVIGRTLIRMGRKISKTYLQVYDYWTTLFFLYKTGVK